MRNPLDEIIGTEGGSKKARSGRRSRADILRGAYNIPARSEGGLMADAAVAALLRRRHLRHPRDDARVDHLPRTLRAGREQNAARYEKIFAERQKLLAGPMRELFKAMGKIREI